MVRTRTVWTISAVIGSLMLAAPAKAQSNQELLDIIRQQQRQIEELTRKVDALAGQAEGANQKAEHATEKADQAAQQADQAAEQATTAVETAQKVEQESPDIQVKWAPGPTFSSKDGNWSVHVRGRLFVDGGALGDEDDRYKNDNGTELRAARLGIEGKFLHDWAYKFETDFANSDVDVKDAFIEYEGAAIDPAYIRVGQYKTPNSLEEQTSARFITFMERAAITDAFSIERQIGLGTGASGESWGVDAGLFGQNTSDVNDNEGYAIAARGHYAFFLGGEEPGEDDRQVIHVGASARYRNFDNDTFNSAVTYRRRPFFHFTGTRSVNTGSVADSESDLFAGAEFAWVDGPFSLQSEVANTALFRKNGQDDSPNLWGGYLSASYFVTGEHRNYNPEAGVFERVKVSNPVDKGGAGAWEIGTRADYIDLNSKDVKGGQQVSYVAGVNWYANNWVRLMLDAAVTQVWDARNTQAAVDGSQNVIYGGGLRAQVDW
jgi:phosphate-selective porin OprO and OprP